MAPANAAPGQTYNTTKPMAPMGPPPLGSSSGDGAPGQYAPALAGAAPANLAFANMTANGNMSNPVTPSGAVHSEGFTARKGTVLQAGEVWCDVPLVKQCQSPTVPTSGVKAPGAPVGFARPPVTGVLTGLSDVHASTSAGTKQTLGGGSAAGSVFGGFAETERKNLLVHGVLDGDKAAGKQDLAGSAPALIRGRFGSLLVRPDGTWDYKADAKNPLVKAFGKRQGLLKDIFGLNVKDGATGSEKPIVVVVNLWETLNGANVTA